VSWDIQFNNATALTTSSVRPTRSSFDAPPFPKQPPKV
jgi:hypothetical protein